MTDVFRSPIVLTDGLVSRFRFSLPSRNSHLQLPTAHLIGRSHTGMLETDSDVIGRATWMTNA